MRAHIDAFSGDRHYRDAAEALAQEINQLPGLDEELDLVESLLA